MLQTLCASGFNINLKNTDPQTSCRRTQFGNFRTHNDITTCHIQC